ncbi:Glycosyltransferase, GT2 family [Reichenbachiella faecimaris]|uniref:Glycosyltransferase, GT2 family n=1 Tax=Reichenbachiella faecimaris TaxID=692418 RepID=A0A1W2GHI7_REIFA|nr:glycosyltransferase [Reichenbachiella faecimaris]SMD36107.1 Glycosyltransferase, GT2 family [Reichenbachiella faecimaris]
MTHPKYSVIIPVFNRPDEMKEMLDSLQKQTEKPFEIVLVEDGSTQKSDFLIGDYDLTIEYFFKPNTGPGDSRNFGMKKAKGDYFLFFDSDCVLPEDYFEKLEAAIEELQPDAFGGPDAAHPSFSNVQKAINYAMTSFFTTGGIRGGKKQLDRYQPRSFNMGLKRVVYEKVGGFSDIHPGEDPDLSFRIMAAGFKVSLIHEAKVYHKRRIDFGKFLKQVYKFGVVRVILNRWYPGSDKMVYFLPSIFLFSLVGLLILAPLSTGMSLLPIAFFILLIGIDALRSNSFLVALLAIPASFIQLVGYGYGFLKSQFKLNLLGQNERKAFPSFFFDKK